MCSAGSIPSGSPGSARGGGGRAALLRLVAEPFNRWGNLPEPIALILSGIFTARSDSRTDNRRRRENYADDIVNKLYVRDSLHEETVLPGEDTD